MKLAEYMEDRLESANVSLDEFRELAIRLLNYGVLVRDESQTERELYDRFVRIEELMAEALDIYGLGLHHDRRFEYVRVYPPGSSMPGMDKAEEHAFGGSLRARPTQAEVALMLVLRAQYDKAVREGKLDERGFATEPLEAISLAMKNWLNRSLPEKLLERRRVFQRLKQLRLIDYRSEEDLDHSEAWLRIHPMIVEFVGQGAIDAINGSMDAASTNESAVPENAHVS